MKVSIEPFRLEGRIRSIPSKSFAHRALICAALATGKSRISIGKSSVDIDATRDALMALGAKIREGSGVWQVTPIEKMAGQPLVDAVESGSTLRFLLPVAAALYQEVNFSGRGRLPDRPIGALLDTMADNGCSFSGEKLPLTIRGPLTGTSFTLPGDISSQFVSGLLMAAPLLEGEVRIRLTSHLESGDYVNITLAVMESFGVSVREETPVMSPEAPRKNVQEGQARDPAEGDDRKEDRRKEEKPGTGPVVLQDSGYLVPGGQSFTGTDYAVEGDWSNAAFFLAGGALSGKAVLTGLDPLSVQGDRGILKVLKSFGARVESGDETLVAEGGRRPFEVDLSLMPDSLPILAVLASSCEGGVSRFYNGARLRLKESDRLMTVARMIRDLGGQVEEQPDGLLVTGTGGLKGGTTSSFGDHRLAMAAAMAAVISEAPVEILEPMAVKKSYPNFYEDLESTGGIVHGIELRQQIQDHRLR